MNNYSPDLIIFSAAQQAVLRAVVDRIVPEDDYPGGWDAGVGDYLAAQFQRDLCDKLNLYKLGLDAIDHTAIAKYNARFVYLAHADQDRLLGALEIGHSGIEWPIDPVVFFRMLVEHTMEGYYSDPGNGGNHNRTSWEMIGFQTAEQGQ